MLGSRAARRLTALAAAMTLAALAPGAAQASTISFSGNVLTYTGGSEDNNVTLTLGTEEYSCTTTGVAPCFDVLEASGTITAFPADRCKQEAADEVECSVPDSVVVNLGGGNDFVLDWEGPSTINGGAGNEIALNGNGGNDVIRGDAGNDVLIGHDGDDTLDGGDGDDMFEGFGGVSAADPLATAGKDVYAGGPGRDHVDYGDRTEPLTITIDGAPNDGAAGEADTVGTDVEDVHGGSGADIITGSAGRNAFDGAGGDDTLRGGPGDDMLLGREGEDRVYGEDGGDLIEAGDGDDLVDGGVGADEIFGDELLPCVPSACASGRDTIAARDGFDDDIHCGPGEDTAELDAGDIVPSSGQGVCESVDRSTLPPGDPQDPQRPVVPKPTDPPVQPGADLLVPQLSGLRAGTLRGRGSMVVRYTLSERAVVTFTVQRRAKGRWVRLRGAVRQTGAAGANRLRVSRWKGRRLKPGRYRLVAVARDLAGNQAPPRRAAFRVVR